MWNIRIFEIHWSAVNTTEPTKTFSNCYINTWRSNYEDDPRSSALKVYCTKLESTKMSNENANLQEVVEGGSPSTPCGKDDKKRPASSPVYLEQSLLEKKR